MLSHPFDFEIQADIFSTREMTAIFDERQRFGRWLEFEAALAASQAELGIIPVEAATEISARAKFENLDPAIVRDGYRQSRNSLIPIINGLREACRNGHGEFVHHGATTQDVLDTGQILELRDTFRIIYRDLKKLEKSLADLAGTHSATPMIGRSHGQQALPITFGLKCGVWLAENRRHIERVKNLAPRLLIGQLSGAVGTMAALGGQGREVARRTMARLGLGYATISWHTSRDNIAEAANLMAMISASQEKIANEIVELGKNEIGELREPAPPGAAASSTMPHKRNPVICQRIAVMARQTRALSGTIIEAMVHEHERDGRAIWSEWLAMPQISIYTGAILNYINLVVKELEIAPENMAKNLLLHGDMVLSEWLLFRLGASIGRMKAQEILRALAGEARASDRSLKDCLLADNKTAALLNRDDLAFLDHPEKYIGLAENLINDLLDEISARQVSDPESI
ncbi:MAG: adenylosuccinate lyase family protein [Desulfurivibrionaceae bacterium]|nr:adenylosuccinate lyase family protein [Desulfurivibrionaceae bacterium]